MITIKYFDDFFGTWNDLTGGAGQLIGYTSDGWLNVEKKDWMNFSDISGFLGATRIATGLINDTEFNYLDGVSGAIQTQLNSKMTGNSPITGATNLKIAYDSKGLVTSGATASTADLSDVGAWTDCSSNTISGWSATTTKLMQYKLIGGKTMLFMFEIVGTGTGGSANITLPFTSSAWGNQSAIYACAQSVVTAGGILIPASSSAMSLYPNPTGGNFTSGQQRNLRGQIIINIA